MKMFALPLAVMLLLVLAEMAVLAWHRRVAVCWHDMVLNLNSGHVLMLFFRGAEVAGFAWLLQHASFGWIGQWPVALQWVFAFFAWDFCFYWLHRMHHALPLFWAVHAVHHEGEHFSLSLGIRNSWFSSLSSLPFFAALAVLGLPLHVFVTVGAFHYGVQFYNHNGLVRRSGWLEHLFVTPAHHRVHHGRNAAYIDRNFGGTLILWDQLFGTFQRELPDETVRFGVHARTPSRNPLWANLVPWMRFAGLQAPALAPRGQPAPAAWVAAGGVILYAGVIHLLQFEGQRSASAHGVLSALLFAGTLALGAASDGRRVGGWVWMALGTVGVPLFLQAHGVHAPADAALAMAWFVHAALAWRWSKARATPAPLQGQEAAG